MGASITEEEGLLRRLRLSEETLRRAGERIASSDHASTLVKLVCNIADYAALQSRRVRSWTDQEDLDLLAYAVRGIFEARLLAWYYLRKCDVDMMRKLIEHYMRDEIELEEAWLVLDQGLNLGLGEIAHSLGEHRRTFPGAKRPPNMRQLAALLGAEGDYAAFFKLYSKFVHPSAYSLFGERPKAEAASIRMLLLMNAGIYMEDLAALFGEVETTVLEAEHGRVGPDPGQ